MAQVYDIFDAWWKTIMQESRIPTFGLVEDHTSKVVDAKLCFISVFRWNVVGVEFVLRVEFVQHGGVCTLRYEKETFSMSTGYSMLTVQYKSAISLTLGNLLSSSMREMIFMGFMAIMSKASWLSVNSMCCQLMFSRLYSSCSSLKTWRTKNCCRFSLAKLIHNCSKLEERYSCMRATNHTTQIHALRRYCTISDV